MGRFKDSKKMENTAMMTQSITQAATCTMKAVLQAMSEAAGPTKRNNAVVALQSMSARTSGPALKHPTGRCKICMANYITLKWKLIIYS